MRIVLAGATGFLGRPLTQALASAGHDLTLLTRTPGKRRLPPSTRELAWVPDGSVGAWSSAVAECDAMVNLAGEPIAAGRWTAARKAAIRQSRIDATRSLVRALQTTPRRGRALVNASAVGYYGPHGDEVVTEADGPGSDFLSEVCTEWEGEALRAVSSGARVVLVRTGLVLEHDGGALKPAARPFRLGVGGPIGSGRQFWPWIHREDWLALVVWLLGNDSVEGPFNATAPVPVTNEEFSRSLARALHRPCLLRAPSFALRLAMGEMADALLLGGQRAVPKRALDAGFGFRHPRIDGAMAAIFREV
jgi:uncharacterized protein